MLVTPTTTTVSACRSNKKRWGAKQKSFGISVVGTIRVLARYLRTVPAVDAPDQNTFLASEMVLMRRQLCHCFPECLQVLMPDASEPVTMSAQEYSELVTEIRKLSGICEVDKVCACVCVRGGRGGAESPFP